MHLARIGDLGCEVRILRERCQSQLAHINDLESFGRFAAAAVSGTTEVTGPLVLPGGARANTGELDNIELELLEEQLMAVDSLGAAQDATLAAAYVAAGRMRSRDVGLPAVREKLKAVHDHTRANKTMSETVSAAVVQAQARDFELRIATEELVAEAAAEAQSKEFRIQAVEEELQAVQEMVCRQEAAGQEAASACADAQAKSAQLEAVKAKLHIVYDQVHAHASAADAKRTAIAEVQVRDSEVRIAMEELRAADVSEELARDQIILVEEEELQAMQDETSRHEAVCREASFASMDVASKSQELQTLSQRLADACNRAQVHKSVSENVFSAIVAARDEEMELQIVMEELTAETKAEAHAKSIRLQELRLELRSLDSMTHGYQATSEKLAAAAAEARNKGAQIQEVMRQLEYARDMHEAMGHSATAKMQEMDCELHVTTEELSAAEALAEGYKARARAATVATAEARAAAFRLHAVKAELTSTRETAQQYEVRAALRLLHQRHGVLRSRWEPFAPAGRREHLITTLPGKRMDR